MDKIKIGVIGLGRGMSFAPGKEATALKETLGIELAAVCDMNKEKLEKNREALGEGVKLYTDFEDMINSDIDAVVLANFFDEHTPFAIRALRAGKHVISECTSNATMAQGVALCRAVEESGKIYMLAENYPFSRQMMELRRIYRAGELGEALYGDGEYNHPMSSETNNTISPGVYHWRNTLPATYYCTHAMAPLMMATDTMPVSVQGLSMANPDVYRGTAKRSDPGAVIFCRMDNGAVFKLLGTGLPGHSGYYRIHGARGAAEIERSSGRLHVWHDPWDIPEGQCLDRSYTPEWPEHKELANRAGHGGGDFWTMLMFTDAIREGKQPYLDVYRSVAMSSVGILAWKSALEGGRAFEMPNFRDENDRKRFENDHWNPILKEGMDKDSIPPASIVGYEPSEADLANARADWEKSGYFGMGF